MNIEFKRVIIQNFLSFGNVDLRFNDDGFIRVSGINENPLDNATSNGSGKSSIWEAIIWVITGETLRGAKQVVNAYGDDGAVVDIDFNIDQHRYQIIRSKDHSIRKTSIQILKDNEDISGKGIRDSEKILKDILPDLTASLLGSVIILGQGLPQKFTANTPSGRKEVLETLSKSDFMIEDLKKRVSERKQELSLDLRTIEDSILSAETEQQVLNKQIVDATNRLATLDGEELMSQVEELREKEAIFLREIESCEIESEALSEMIQEQTLAVNELTSNETKELQELSNAFEQIIRPLKDKEYSLKAEYTSLTKQLNQMLSITDVCPTCGQKLPDVHKPDTTKISEEIKICQDESHRVAGLIVDQDTLYSSNKKVITDKYSIEKAELTGNLTNNKYKLSEVRSKKLLLNNQQGDVHKFLMTKEFELAQIQTTVDSCNQIIRENNEKLSLLTDKILYNNKQRDLTQSHLDVISKFETALKRDFRGYLLSTVINFIENRAKYYSQVIFDTDLVSFALDGNNIDISYMNKQYENLSSGEKQKIDLIIQFSIRDMLSAQLGFTSNILVLDEVFDGLDSVGCTKVIDLIASLSDIKNIFIVTHRKDLSLPTDKELVVVKSSAGISEIKQ